MGQILGESELVFLLGENLVFLRKWNDCIPLGWRRRFGPGRGMGRYFAWNWPSSSKEQLQALKEYKQAFKEELEDGKREERKLEVKNKRSPA